MPFPYTFPFVFDGPIILVAAEVGSGVEAVTAIAVLISSDGGTGAELSILLKAIFSSDEGRGLDALKAMVGASGSDIRLLGHSRQVGMPSKGVKR